MDVTGGVRLTASTDLKVMTWIERVLDLNVDSTRVASNVQPG